MKKFISLTLLLIFVLNLSGCKKKQVIVEQKAPVTLTYYKLYDNKEIYAQSIQGFREKFPYVSVNIKTFQDKDSYLNTIIREIAEGRGPDLFSVPNTWVKSNFKLLQEAPAAITPEIYQNTYINTAFEDNTIQKSDGSVAIYGIPLSVDTLALYYNSQLFENTIPERGKPQSTWAGINQDSKILTSKNENNIKRAGVALGSKETNRNSDTYMLRLLQNKINFYDKTASQVAFTKNNKSLEIFKEMQSYANPKSTNFTYDKSLNLPNLKDKEVSAFAQGKTAMIFGYSHLYKDILNKIDLYKSSGLETISKSSVKITEAPQEVISDNKIAYANYLTEVVNRNSNHGFEAFALLGELSSQKSLNQIYSKDFKPTSRRDMIPSQRQNRIYGAFANQLGYAKSIALPSTNVEKIINEMFDQQTLQKLDEVQYATVLNQAASKINKEIFNNNKINPIIEVETK